MAANAFVVLGPLWQLTLICALLALGICDLLYRRIGNALIGSVLVLGLTAQFLAFGPTALCRAVAVSVATLAATIALWLVGAVGAADVKMLAALAACAGLEHLGAYLIYTCVAAGCLGLWVGIQPSHGQPGASMSLTALMTGDALKRAREAGRTVPLAVALGVGLLGSLATTG